LFEKNIWFLRVQKTWVLGEEFPHKMFRSLQKAVSPFFFRKTLFVMTKKFFSGEPFFFTKINMWANKISSFRSLIKEGGCVRSMFCGIDDTVFDAVI
jgi:hypothetical protein